MFLPIGDTPNPRSFTPFVNYTLILTNIVIYFAVSLPMTMTAPDAGASDLSEYLQYLLRFAPGGFSAQDMAPHINAYDVYVYAHGYKPAAPEFTDLFSSLFLHGGFGHLAGNMLFLWIYGDNVEHRLGRWQYLLSYLAWGLIATLCYGLVSSAPEAPLVGASGAISGVLGYYFIFFPHNKVKVLIFLFPFFMKVILVPTRIVLSIYLVLENVLPAIFSAASSVAYGAHIGGFVAGLALAGATKIKPRDSQP